MVRLSGSGTFERLEPLFVCSARPVDGLGVDRPGVTATVGSPVIEPRVPFQVELRWRPDASPLPVTVLGFDAGRSYTGQESVEIYLPGSPVLVRRLLETLRQSGFEPAEPGEFTRRAFLNGRLDLTQAESVAQVIDAADRHALAAARRVLAGSLAESVRGIGERLHDLIALLEAGLDFSEQEVEPPDPEWIQEQLTPIQREVARLLDDRHRENSASGRSRVILWGQANAGKSTLFNRLLGVDRAITSSSPGTTRDAVTASWVRDPWPALTLVDLPGERAEAEGPERVALYLARELRADADLLLHVFDATRPLDSVLEDARAIEGGAAPLISVAAQADRLDPAHAASDRWSAIDPKPILVSAHTGIGLEALLRAVDQHLGAGAGSVREGGLTFTDRQLGRLQECEEVLVSLEQDLSVGLAESELIVVELREAHDRLAEVTGEISTEATLDRIFARFCLGK